MPELAFGYLLYTKLQSVLKIIFDDTFQVKREVQIINNDLTDIVITTNEGYHTAIEIKFDNTWNSYANDILKLSKIPPDKIHLRIFMGLKWFLPDNDDRRFVNDIYAYCTHNGINAKELIHEQMDTKVKNKAPLPSSHYGRLKLNNIFSLMLYFLYRPDNDSSISFHIIHIG